MRWLVLHHRRDRGAVAVFVAISMVALLGFTALGVDGTALWSDQKQLQNGADAGALAIAQNCADGNCGNANTTANDYAVSNKFDGNASGMVTNLNTSEQTVTVRDSSTRHLWFAPAIGIETAGVSAEATAHWGQKTAGTFLPLIFSLCAFWAQSDKVDGVPVPGTSLTLHFKSVGATDPSLIDNTNVEATCAPLISQDTNGAHNEVAGGFGWLDKNVTTGATLSTSCSLPASVGDWLGSDPGLNVSTACDNALSGSGSLVDRIVQLPIFDQCKSDTGKCDGGNNSEYHVYGIASFKITSYCFDNKVNGQEGGGTVTQCPADRRISGEFLSYTTADSTIGPPGPPMGAGQVSLIK